VIELKNEIVIDRPREEVFDFVSTFENVPKWNKYIHKVTKTSDGPVGVGSTFHQVRETEEQDFRVVTYEPNHELAVESIGSSSPKFKRHVTFESEGDDATRITDEWKMEMSRSALIEHLEAGEVESAVQGNLERLKALLETG
jgi:uncharacterized membrane protein